MWLRDLLPSQAPEARIMVYGYNSALIGPNNSVSNVEDFARDLLGRIVNDRTTHEVCSIVVFLTVLTIIRAFLARCYFSATLWAV